ncbi:MAG: hypothetical protein QOJ51_6519, partial [Acidobacteriaceae bacterium]|nr:hypothetical protein [Acidobacteriaceae bacterium]
MEVRTTGLCYVPIRFCYTIDPHSRRAIRRLKNISGLPVVL